MARQFTLVARIIGQIAHSLTGVDINPAAQIGGSVWLTRSVPPGSNIAQAHARDVLLTEGEGI